MEPRERCPCIAYRYALDLNVLVRFHVGLLHQHEGAVDLGEATFLVDRAQDNLDGRPAFDYGGL
jgi:hypothetical protein